VLTKVHTDCEQYRTWLNDLIDRAALHEMIEVLQTQCPTCTLRCPGISKCPVMPKPSPFSLHPETAPSRIISR